MFLQCFQSADHRLYGKRVGPGRGEGGGRREKDYKPLLYQKRLTDNSSFSTSSIYVAL